jgi:prepilin-type N-terminal cleavage/methylation domain-containing protein
MRLNQRGATLIELIVAMGLAGIVVTAAYQAYISSVRIQEAEVRRESMTLTVQNLMHRIKQDVRASRHAVARGGTLELNKAGKNVTYRSLPGGDGVERTAGRGRMVYRFVTADFSENGNGVRGVNVRLRLNAIERGRKVRVDVSSFISPRNR